jgi:hypothetical protein
VGVDHGRAHIRMTSLNAPFVKKARCERGKYCGLLDAKDRRNHEPGDHKNRKTSVLNSSRKQPCFSQRSPIAKKPVFRYSRAYTGLAEASGITVTLLQASFNSIHAAPRIRGKII